jgi:hypothetical protein
MAAQRAGPISLRTYGSGDLSETYAIARGPSPMLIALGIANFEETAECHGNLITASVAADGKFTRTNGRNGFSKTYVAQQAK